MVPYVDQRDLSRTHNSVKTPQARTCRGISNLIALVWDQLRFGFSASTVSESGAGVLEDAEVPGKQRGRSDPRTLHFWADLTIIPREATHFMGCTQFQDRRAFPGGDGKLRRFAGPLRAGHVAHAEAARPPSEILGGGRIPGLS